MPTLSETFRGASKFRGESAFWDRFGTVFEPLAPLPGAYGTRRPMKLANKLCQGISIMPGDPAAACTQLCWHRQNRIKSEFPIFTYRR